jgi:hypothetical protein
MVLTHGAPYLTPRARTTRAYAPDGPEVAIGHDAMVTTLAELTAMLLAVG